MTAYWSNAALAASHGILFVRPAVIAGNEAGSHPFSHLLAPLFEEGGNGGLITVRAEDVLEQETIRIAARTITRCQDVPKGTPEAQESWPVPPIAEILAEKVESPTSLETLSTCHLKWLLSHVAELGAGRIRSIPDANRLFGNIAHAISQEVFLPGPVPSGSQARKHAEQIFDRVVQQIAAPLLKPGGAGDLAFARERIPSALETLAELLSKDGWEIIGTEMEVTHDFGNGLRVKGYHRPSCSTSRARYRRHRPQVGEARQAAPRRGQEGPCRADLHLRPHRGAGQVPAGRVLHARAGIDAGRAGVSAREGSRQGRQEPRGHLGCRRRHASVLERHGGFGNGGGFGDQGCSRASRSRHGPAEGPLRVLRLRQALPNPTSQLRSRLMTGRVDTTIASAGTGKTTKLVSLIAEDIKTVEPERILATTFTVKAADELIERARARPRG